MNAFTQTLVAVAAVAVVVFVGFHVGERVTCWHIPYVTSGCTAK